MTTATTTIFNCLDILCEISKYFNNIIDYLNLSKINKFCYNNLLAITINTEIDKIWNNLEFELKLSDKISDELYENNDDLENINLKLELLSKNIPNYIYNNVRKLNIELNEYTNYLLYKFNKIKYLKVKEFNSKYNFNELPFLKTLIIKNGCLQKNSLLKLKKLKCLELNYNYIQDDFFNELINLTSLKLNNCNRTFTGNCLQYLKKLKTLHVTGSKVTDDNLKQSINLTDLNIECCYEVNGTCLQYLQNLETLNVECCENLISLQNIGKLNNLKTLNVSNLGGKDKSFLNSLPNLENLFISCCYKDEDFYNLKNLKCLTIYDSQLNGNCLQYLNNLEKLICELNVFKDLNYLQNIKQLFIDGIQKYLTDKDLQNLKNTISLNLNSDNENITGECLLNMENLITLNSSCKNLEDKYFINLKNLKTLHIGYGGKVTGEYFYNLKSLTDLDICNNQNIKDEHLISLNNLQYLNIDFCNIKGECLLHLNKLKEIDMRETEIKDEHLENLINLEKLHMVDCNNLVNGQFLLKMKNLKELWIVRDYFNEDIKEDKELILEGKTLSEIRDRFK
ncbi:hypothetical protein ABK040_012255 [Willaertia magna]